MKIFDCTTYYSEDLMLDVRFNILNEHVHKFIVVESKFSHSGEPKELNFNINNFNKFKDKIIYLSIDNEPRDIIIDTNEVKKPEIKRQNSIKRIELSYNYIMNAVEEAQDNDLIILSDNDEIPNLNSKQFKKSKKDIIIFKQLFFYYKFNLLYDLMPWFGSKASKKKTLKSLSWLKNLKNKKYPFWRLDALFSKTKNINIDIIEDGGWHFTNVMSPEKLFNKMMNFGHHDEFELSGLTIDDIKKNILQKKVFYNHFADQKDSNKWNYNYILKKIDNSLLPKYLIDNKDNYREWFE